jgi:hypothetical protein
MRADIREIRTEQADTRKDVASIMVAVARIEGHLEGEVTGAKRVTDAADRDAERADRVAKRVTDRADKVADRTWRARSFVVEVAATLAVMLSAYAAFLH